MCRNIKTLFNFEPVATDDEIHAASLQFVRKISGFSRPSRVVSAQPPRGSIELAVTRETQNCSSVTCAACFSA